MYHIIVIQLSHQYVSVDVIFWFFSLKIIEDYASHFITFLNFFEDGLKSLIYYFVLCIITRDIKIQSK